jgi:hypothetical protein
LKKQSLGGRIAFWLSGPALFGLLLSELFLQRLLCPAGTLVAGHLLGLGMAIGAITCSFGLILIAVKSFAEINPKLSFEKVEKARLLGLAGIPIVIFSLGLWFDGFFTYYCASASQIVLHPDPFLNPITYSWADVRKVITGCSYGKGMSVRFDLEFSDGQVVPLGTDSWRMTTANYPMIDLNLRSAKFQYDPKPKPCPKRLDRYFSERSASSGN